MAQNKFLNLVNPGTLKIVPSNEVVLCNETDLDGSCEINYPFPVHFPCFIRNLGC